MKKQPFLSMPHPRCLLFLALLACLVLSGCATVPYTGRSQLVFMDQSQ